jgi:hypothetical protein
MSFTHAAEHHVQGALLLTTNQSQKTNLLGSFLTFFVESLHTPRLLRHA